MLAKRDNAVTIAKAIGIVCVVMAHAMCPQWLTWKVIYTFHMPLFFLLSGYCFKEKYLDDAWLFVKRKLQGVYMPYVAYSLVFLALHNLFCDWHIYSQDWYYGWKDYLWMTGKIVTRMSNEGGMLGIFWFLKELFWGNLFFYGLLKLGKGKKWIPIVVLACLTIIMTITGWRVPYFSISKTTFYAAFFIALGYAGRNYNDRLDKWWIYVFAAFTIAAYVWVGRNIAIGAQDVYTIVPYTLTAIGGSLLVMRSSKWLSAKGGQNPLLLFVGNHTLEIMALHFITFKLVSYCLIQAYGMPIEKLEDFPVMMDYSLKGWWVVYTLIGIALPTGFAWGLERLKTMMRTVE